MPLDDFQKSVLKVLMPLRSPDSVFAGGSVLHRHGFRLSDDQDIFNAEHTDVLATAERDTQALRRSGFEVDLRRPHEGLVEALVARAQYEDASSAGEAGATKIQWVETGSWTFFKPVPDPELGWRLHMADLAVNKALAAGGRRQVRDYIDLVLIHRHIMPLWHALWAAPGKDESWSPGSLAEKIAMKNGFRQADIDDQVLSTVDLSAAEVGATVREAIEEAREVFNRLPAGTAGKLFVDAAGQPVNDVDAIRTGAGVTAVEARRGGTWPSGTDIDHTLIQRVIDAFGWEGSGPDGVGVTDARSGP